MKINNTKKLTYSLLDQCIVSGANFITGLLIARNFSSDFYGAFYFGFLSIIIVISILQRPFIGSPISIFPQKNLHSTEEKNTYFSKKVTHQIIISIISSGFLTLLFWYKGFTDPKCYLAVIGAIWFIQIQELYRSVLFAKTEIVSVFWNDFLSYGTRILLFFLVTWSNSAELSTLFAILGISSFLGIILGYFQTRIPTFIVVDRQVLHRDFHFGKWLFLEALLAACSYGGYMILMSRFVDDFRFGTLAACDTLMKVLNILFIGLFNLITPLAARRFEENHESFLLFIRRLRIYGTIIVLIICFSIYASKDIIFHVLYADKFTNYSMTLLLMMAANFAFFHQFIYVMMAKVYEKTQIIFLARITSTIFSLSAGIFLAIQFSIEGIAITITLSAFIAVLFLTIRINPIVSREKSKRFINNIPL